MESFSFDENGNVPLINLPTSTPKKQLQPSTKLVCQHCGRSYVSRFYFNKHVDGHTATNVDRTQAGSSPRRGLCVPVISLSQMLILLWFGVCGLYICSNSFFGSIFITVAPALNVSVVSNADPNDISLPHFVVPSAPAPNKKTGNKAKTKKKPHLICTYCLKAYVCSRSFKSHIRAHQIQGKYYLIHLKQFC